jgi:hypothetical protein
MKNSEYKETGGTGPHHKGWGSIKGPIDWGKPIIIGGFGGVGTSFGVKPGS